VAGSRYGQLCGGFAQTLQFPQASVSQHFPEQPMGGPLQVLLQPSGSPHFLPAQLGVQPQTSGVPPPPQLSGAMQLLGQVPLQPSAPPHLPAQLAVQPQAFGVPPPPQVLGAMQLLGQVPLQASGPPHLPAQAGLQPQTLGIPPPPQVFGGGQLPALHLPPQPSSAPQGFPSQLGARGLSHDPSHWTVPPQLPQGAPGLGATQSHRASGKLPRHTRPGPHGDFLIPMQLLAGSAEHSAS
jgi:hypothetical protein